MVPLRPEIKTPLNIGLNSLIWCYTFGRSGILVTAAVWYLHSFVWCWYNKSMAYILVRARVLCEGHAPRVSSYGSAVKELTTLCRRSSRACSSCSVALEAWSSVLVVLVVTAVCGLYHQRPDALSSLVVRSHVFVYLWCWYSGMVYMLDRSSCSVAPK